ncbi:MAG: AAA family ATPase [Kiritimatiellae bacterium]|nr:AAA family ATPase [Kiritimatiellia bacterium]
MRKEKRRIIRGKVYVLGDNIDTDQIIPAQYLNLVPTIPEEYSKLGSYALSGLPDTHAPFIAPGASASPYTIIVAGRNFGCGSSREHAPVALGAAGVEAVVAESYARIFFRNAVSTGEVFPCESAERLCEIFTTGMDAEIDLDAGRIVEEHSASSFALKPLGAVRPVIEAGGLFEYARAAGMIGGKGSVAIPRERRARIVALANQKGGVGKTTTAVNLAACLADAGRRVLLIDLDPQASATSGLGVAKEAGTSVYKALLGEVRMEDRIIPVPDRGLDMIPSEVDLAGAEVDVARSDRYLHRLRDALLPVLGSRDYDFVILDCPPSLGILTMNALATADALVIPVQCEYYALEGLSIMTQLVQQMRSSGTNPDLELEGILMTMYDARTNLAHQVVREVRKHLGRLVYKTVIPRSVRLSEAPSHGLPAGAYDRHSTGAKAYYRFGKEFMKRSRHARAKA